MKAGTYNAGTTKARSLIRVPVPTSIVGSTVISATLTLKNYYSSSCTGHAVRAALITSDWDPTTVVWTNMPAHSNTYAADVSTALGYNTSCPGGDVSWNVASIAQQWANGAGRYGIMMRGGSETDSLTWRNWYSDNYVYQGQVPRMTVVYNHYSNTPAAPSNMDPQATPNWFRTTTPILGVVVTDPDGGNVKATFQVQRVSDGTIWQWGSGWVTSGSVATATIPAGYLTDGGVYNLWAIADDGTWFGSWSGMTTFTVDATSPTVQVAAQAWTNGQWLPTTTPPASNQFTFTGTSDTTRFDVSTDNGWLSGSVTASSGVANRSYVPPTQGGHFVKVTSVDRAGNRSVTASFSYGYGTLHMDRPASEPVEKTSGTVRIEASGPADSTLSGLTGSALAAKVHLQWRVAASGLGSAGGWNNATWTGNPSITASATGGVALAGAWDAQTAKVDAHFDPDGPSGPLTSYTLDERVPVLLDLQMCVDYVAGTQCTWENNPAARRQILRVPHAFGDGFPVTGIDGGQVALWTGEFTTTETDSEFSAGASTLSVSRTHSTFGGPGTSAASNVFGPGWTANLDGPSTGLSIYQVVDNTLVDGTIKLVNDTGGVMVFAPSAAFDADDWLGRRSGADLDAGLWLPLDETTAEAGIDATVSGTGAGTTLTLTEADGVATVFKPATSVQSPTSSAAAALTPSAVVEPGTGSTSFSYDAAGRATRILGPIEAGVSCPASGALPAGCRALQFTYATATTAVGTSSGQWGNVSGQVVQLDALMGTGPAGTPVTTVIPQTSYLYDNLGRLRKVTDVRTGLATTYEYEADALAGGGYGQPRMTGITAPGLTPISYEYSDASDGHRFVTASRVRPSGGTAQLSKIVYGISLSGTNLPDMTADPVSGVAMMDAWSAQAGVQMPRPATGTAVFGPDHAVAGTAGSPDWKYADLSYTDARGYEVYTASFGAGDWQFTATEYDAKSNAIRALDEGDISAIRAGELPAASAGTLTVYNASITGASTDVNPLGVLLEAGTVVTDVYDSARSVVLPDGTIAWARPHTSTTYDDGAPNSKLNPATGQRYALATKKIVSLASPTVVRVGDVGNVDTAHLTDGLAGNETVLSQTLTGYDDAIPVQVAGVVNDTGTGLPADGAWARGLASTTTVVMGSTPGAPDLVSRTAYDAHGRVVATVAPAAVAGASGVPVPAVSGTRETVYYTASTNNRAPACGNKPEWSGWVCLNRYANNNPGSGPLLTSSQVTDYNAYGQPKTVVETNGTGTRTSTTAYDAAGRVTTNSLAVSGVSGSLPVVATTSTYDPATGLPTSVVPTTGLPISQTYDSWGRQVTYTVGSAGSAETTTTTYDSAGRVATVTDPSLSGGAVSTYYYDADGQASGDPEEHRGLLTRVSTSRSSSGGAISVSGVYDASRNLVTERFPGGVSKHLTYDTGDQLASLSYDVGGSTVYAWTLAHDGLERVAGENTPDPGVVVTGSNAGDLATGDSSTGRTASGYKRAYAYDRASRLVRVVDHTVSGSSIASCLIRDYGFDRNGNRTSLTSTPSGGTGECQTPGGSGTGATSKASTYDNADRLSVASGYVYDAFGRATTVPQADTPAYRAGGSPGSASVSYYDSDAVRSIAQNGTTTTFDLDGLGRRSSSQTGPTAGTATSSTVRHYTDSSDNPGWSVTTTGSTTTSERYVSGLDGMLAATILSGSELGGGTVDGVVQVAVTNPHGDVSSEIKVAGDDTVSLGAWRTSDEYGNPIDSAATGTTATNPVGQAAGSSGGLGYGWLGGKERATDSSGLVLMGARLYNPVTGQFTSPDPVFGGNTTAYVYPQDPINAFDLDGKGLFKAVKGAVKKGASKVKKAAVSAAKTYVTAQVNRAVKVGRTAVTAWKATAKAATGNSWLAKTLRVCCNYSPGAVGAGCGAYYAAAYLTVNNKSEAGKWAASGVAAFVGGGAVSAGLTRGLAGVAGKKEATAVMKAAPRFGVLRTTRYVSSNLHGIAANNAVGYIWDRS